jgi:hypothetical protein
MATSGEVIERFAAVAGLLPSTLERMLRPLRGAGLVPVGVKGRGQAHGHFEPPHLANLIMALAGMQPSDAAEAVSLVRPLVLEEATSAEGSRPPDLGSTLEHLICEAATRGDSGLAADFTVTFCLNPAQGILNRPDGDGELRQWRYKPRQEALPNMPRKHPPAVWRITTVGPEVLMLAGELWRDALRNRAAVLLYVDPDALVSTRQKSGAASLSEEAASQPQLGRFHRPDRSDA